MMLSPAEQWEALELTRRTLQQRAAKLPSRLVNILLPRVGIYIERVLFENSSLVPTTRTCTVEYVVVEDPFSNNNNPDRSNNNNSDLKRGTLESVVWNGVLYGNAPVVPPDVRLCTCESFEEFKLYLYVALGRNNVGPRKGGTACKGPVATETLHRSWTEYNFAVWDSGADDLTSRYAAIRSMVVFPPAFHCNDKYDPVVRISAPTAGDEEAAAAAALAVKKAYEAAYKSNYATAKETRTWGLGALAFFGTCGGNANVWRAAMDEARRWFSPVAAAPVTTRPHHFPEATAALTLYAKEDIVRGHFIQAVANSFWMNVGEIGGSREEATVRALRGSPNHRLDALATKIAREDVMISRMPRDPTALFAACYYDRRDLSTFDATAPTTRYPYECPPVHHQAVALVQKLMQQQQKRDVESLLDYFVRGLCNVMASKVVSDGENWAHIGLLRAWYYRNFAQVGFSVVLKDAVKCETARLLLGGGGGEVEKKTATTLVDEVVDVAFGMLSYNSEKRCIGVSHSGVQ